MTDGRRVAGILLAWLLVLGCGPTEPGEKASDSDSGTASLSCGDGTCDGSETPASCADDCLADCGDGWCTHNEDAAVCADDCRAICGDGACTHTESAASCDVDCVATCGDGWCTHNESGASCEQDCAATCGDGACSHSETASSCAEDCPAVCEDGWCTHAESAASCAADCPGSCGDAVCSDGETAISCADDCAAVCGDAACTHAESALTCPSECLPQCGDGGCTHGEDYLGCPSDCETTCGDGACAGVEDAASCPGDCEAECGDEACTHDEDAVSCPGDCDAVCPDGACTHDEDYESCPQECPNCPGDVGCPYGLTERPPVSACALEGDPGTFAYRQVDEPFADGFDKPIQVVSHPGEPNRLFVVELGGTIQSISRTDPNDRYTFLDIADRTTVTGEGGMLNLVFAPDYMVTGTIYTIRSQGSPLRTVLARYTVDTPGTGGVADPDSGVRLMQLRKPSGLHFGGQLLFGPDGMLYISTGDGGNGGDLSRDLGSPHGKMMRIDVNNPLPGLLYGIPADNPHAVDGMVCHDCFMNLDYSCPDACAEVWASGLRNPWRCSFDADGRLWCGDVGKASWEEINLIEKGKDYGWNCLENTDPSENANPAIPCDGTYAPPMFAYEHGTGTAAITGGLIYKGNHFPDLVGTYVFADNQLGQLWSLTHDDGVYQSHRELTNLSGYIVSIGEDTDGELYFVDFAGGALLQIEASAPSSAGSFPLKLSETGCYANLATQTPQSDFLPYDVNMALWSDGTVKRRYLRLPSDTATMSLPAGLGASDAAAELPLDVPDGTMLIKEFYWPVPSLGGALRPLETRFLVRRSASKWDLYTYQWREDGTDADLVPLGAEGCYDALGRETDGDCVFEHSFPSTAQCFSCHTTASGRVLGPVPAQLNGIVDYGLESDNQLRALNHLGLFDPPLAALPADLPAFPSLDDEDATVDERARAYLASNCSMCHQPNSTMDLIDLRYGTPLPLRDVCDVEPNRDDLDLDDARIVAPGDPDASVLLARMSRRGEHQMPPLGTHLVHEEAVTLLTAWIAEMGTCLP